jgi:hypothetical protein
MKVMRIDSENTKRDLASRTRDCERMMLERQRFMEDRNRIRADLNRERTLNRQLTTTGEDRLAQISRLELDNRSLREAAGAAAAVAAGATWSAQGEEEDVDDSGFIASDGEADDADARGAKRMRTREWQPPAPPLSSAALEPPSLMAASDTVSSSARTRASRRSGVPAVAPLPSLLPGAGSKASLNTVQVGEESLLGNSPDWWLNIATVFDQEAGPSGMGYI